MVFKSINKREGIFLFGARFENFDSDGLSNLLDFLHSLANPCSGGLVATLGLSEVIFHIGYHLLQLIVFLHKYCPFRIPSVLL